MSHETLTRFDPARARAAVAALRARRRFQWFEWLIGLMLVAMVGRGAAIVYSVRLLGEASASDANNLHHEALARRLKALRYARIATWPLLTGQDRAEYARQLALISQSYDGLGDAANALAYIAEARRLATTSGDSEIAAAVHVVSADLRRDLDPAGAREEYLEAHRLYNQRRDLSSDISIHVRLADAAIAARDFKGALAELDKADAVARGRNFQATLKRAEALYNVGQYEKAFALTDLDAAAKSDPPRPRNRFDYTSLPNDDRFLLAGGIDWIDTYPALRTDILLKLGRYKEARDAVFALRPMVGSELMTSPDTIVQYYARGGWVQEKLGLTDRAVNLFLASIRTLETYRRSVPEALRTRFFAKEVYAVPYRHLTGLLAKRPPAAAPPKELAAYGATNFEAAVYFAEARKARAFLEQMAASGRYAAGTVDAAVAARERALREERSRRRAALEAAIAKGGFTPRRITDRPRANGGRSSPAGPDAVWLSGEKQIVVASPSQAVIDADRRLYAIDQEWTAFENELFRRAPRYASLRYPRPVPLAQVPLGRDEVALEYALSDGESFIFLVDGGGGREVFHTKLDEDEAARLIADYLAPIGRGETRPDPLLGRKLFDLLLAAPLSRIDPGRRIVVVPDGVLWTLPLEILPGRDGAPVGDDWNITYTPSLAVLALNRLAPAPNPRQPFFGLGDVAYASRESAQVTPGSLRLRGIYIDRSEYVFPALPETKREIEAAAGVFGTPARPPDVLTGEAATETRFKRTPLDRYKVVHLATHGVNHSDLAGVREPALILARDIENDGILRASEVAGLTFGSSLVVLAACKTGLGEELGGEGVMSMARAFQHAGARTVVMSLWNVPSEVTETLFKVFYQELQAGRGAAASLRAARLAVRKHFPDPFYWGAFVVVGEGR